MELITILRTLGRHRLLVILSALLAVGIGVVVAYRVSLSPPGLHDRQYKVGVASSTILVDTPRSTVADLNPAGADVLQARTDLLANLMASPPLEVMIAKNAGISPNALVVVPPAEIGTIVPTTLAVGAAATSSSAPYQLNISANQTLPLISISAQAPTGRQAALLAGGAVNALKQYLGSVAGIQNIPAGSRPVITPLGLPSPGTVVRGPRRIYGALAALVAFVLLCAGIVVASGLARLWRSSSTHNEPPGDAWQPFDGTDVPALSYGEATAATRSSNATIDAVHLVADAVNALASNNGALRQTAHDAGHKSASDRPASGRLWGLGKLVNGHSAPRADAGAKDSPGQDENSTANPA